MSTYYEGIYRARKSTLRPDNQHLCNIKSQFKKLQRYTFAIWTSEFLGQKSVLSVFIAIEYWWKLLLCAWQFVIIYGLAPLTCTSFMFHTTTCAKHDGINEIISIINVQVHVINANLISCRNNFSSGGELLGRQPVYIIGCHRVLRHLNAIKISLSSGDTKHHPYRRNDTIHWKQQSTI